MNPVTDSNPGTDSPSSHDPQRIRTRSDEALHAEKYRDSRVEISRRTWLLGSLTLLLVAVVTAVGSIYARRTRLVRTTKFWGSETITALQLADRVDLLPGPGQDFPAVDLTAMPGLGHLRRALLDERHFEWGTEIDAAVAEVCQTEGAKCVRLRFADPVGKRVPVTTIHLELRDGWVGPGDGTHRVRVTDRVRPALRHQLELLMNATQTRSDYRAAE